MIYSVKLFLTAPRDAKAFFRTVKSENRNANEREGGQEMGLRIMLFSFYRRVTGRLKVPKRHKKQKE